MNSVRNSMHRWSLNALTRSQCSDVECSRQIRSLFLAQSIQMCKNRQNTRWIRMNVHRAYSNWAERLALHQPQPIVSLFTYISHCYIVLSLYHTAHTNKIIYQFQPADDQPTGKILWIFLHVLSLKHSYKWFVCWMASYTRLHYIWTRLTASAQAHIMEYMLVAHRVCDIIQYYNL